MTFEQGEKIIELLEYIVEFIDGFLGGYTVELFNVFAFLGILACSLLVAIFVISSISKR
jgi:hypothetical protein